MRVALFGGSFDPPHRGHAAIARAAADRFCLDQVLFAPVGRQPLKSAATVTPFELRLAMTTLACEDDPRFVSSDLDAPRPDGRPNYTVDTLAKLAESMRNAQLFSLAGADSFRDLARWREPEHLLALAEWIVVSRPGFPLAAASPGPSGMSISEAQRGRIHVLDWVNEEVSATELRARLSAGDSCAELLSPRVAAYIGERDLYLAPGSNAPARPPPS